jgi:hypothetical protein
VVSLAGRRRLEVSSSPLFIGCKSQPPMTPILAGTSDYESNRMPRVITAGLLPCPALCCSWGRYVQLEEVASWGTSWRSGFGKVYPQTAKNPVDCPRARPEQGSIHGKGLYPAR